MQLCTLDRDQVSNYSRRSLCTDRMLLLKLMSEVTDKPSILRRTPVRRRSRVLVRAAQNWSQKPEGGAGGEAQKKFSGLCCTGVLGPGLHSEVAGKKNLFFWKRCSTKVASFTTGSSCIEFFSILFLLWEKWCDTFQWLTKPVISELFSIQAIYICKI